jgi:DNA-binding CsgD family transcriptional regulator
MKDELEQLYIKEGKTLKEIANIYGVSHQTIRNRCISSNDS